MSTSCLLGTDADHRSRASAPAALAGRCEPPGHHRSRCVRCPDRGEPAYPRLHPRPLSPVVRVLYARRLDRDPLHGPAVAALRRIERLFAGGRLETPAGTLDLPTLVASSAGPDLREAILGSEGRLGIITSATVRISPVPEFERFEAFFFSELRPGGWRRSGRWRRPGCQLSMLRLSDATETAEPLRRAGAKRAGATQQVCARPWLRWRLLHADGRRHRNRWRATTPAHEGRWCVASAASPFPAAPSAPRWAGRASTPRTCATRCGSWDTRSTRWRLRPTGRGWTPRGRAIEDALRDGLADW